jgi:hypothetical protein
MTDKTRGIFLVYALLSVAVAAAGCGGGDSNSPGTTDAHAAELAQFTGTWQYTQSMGTLSCPGSADSSGLLGTTKQWDSGVTSDLVDMTPAILDFTVQCFYTFDVNSKVATIQPGQSCGITDGAGTQVATETPTSWTFTLTSATTADEVLTTSIPPCTLSGMATLKKIATSN